MPTDDNSQVSIHCLAKDGRPWFHLEEQAQLQAAIVLQVCVRVQAVVHTLHTHFSLSAHSKSSCSAILSERPMCTAPDQRLFWRC